VAAAAGVPGSLISIATMEPPYMAERYKAANMLMPVSGGKAKVTGTRMAMAMVAVRPGSTPTIRPMTTPRTMAKILAGRRTVARPSNMLSEIVIITVTVP
jgi:hypothetical protein